jgi:hypothetical protein
MVTLQVFAIHWVAGSDIARASGAMRRPILAEWSVNEIMTKMHRCSAAK